MYRYRTYWVNVGELSQFQDIFDGRFFLVDWWRLDQRGRIGCHDARHLCRFAPTDLLKQCLCLFVSLGYWQVLNEDAVVYQVV